MIEELDDICSNEKVRAEGRRGNKNDGLRGNLRGEATVLLLYS